jgi:hypothetical protein
MDRLLQSLKQSSPRVHTLEGMHMEGNELQSLKALASIRDRLELGSNVSMDRLLHPLKQCLPIVPTLEGMYMDDNDLDSLKA